MTTFALVHGGAHGGWCREHLDPELPRFGHDAVTPDLPIEDDDADLTDYASAVVREFPDGGGDDVVVVGHSMGAWVIPVVAAMRPVRRMVFLGPTVPAIGISPAEQHKREPDMMIKEVTPNADYGEHPTSGVDSQRASKQRIAGTPILGAARHAR